VRFPSANRKMQLSQPHNNIRYFPLFKQTIWLLSSINSAFPYIHLTTLTPHIIMIYYPVFHQWTLDTRFSWFISTDFRTKLEVALSGAGPSCVRRSLLCGSLTLRLFGTKGLLLLSQRRLPGIYPLPSLCLPLSRGRRRSWS